MDTQPLSCEHLGAPFNGPFPYAVDTSIPTTSRRFQVRDEFSGNVGEVIARLGETANR